MPERVDDGEEREVGSGADDGDVTALGLALAGHAEVIDLQRHRSTSTSMRVPGGPGLILKRSARRFTPMSPRPMPVLLL